MTRSYKRHLPWQAYSGVIYDDTGKDLDPYLLTPSDKEKSGDDMSHGGDDSDLDANVPLACLGPVPGSDDEPSMASVTPIGPADAHDQAAMAGQPGHPRGSQAPAPTTPDSKGRSAIPETRDPRFAPKAWPTPIEMFYPTGDSLPARSFRARHRVMTPLPTGQRMFRIGQRKLSPTTTLTYKNMVDKLAQDIREEPSSSRRKRPGAVLLAQTTWLDAFR